MGGYAYYFIIKLAMYAGEYIDFHFWWNLAFALALTWPVKRRPLRIARHLVAIPLAAALLWHDSWLPPFERVIAQRHDVMQFSWTYLTELIGRFIHFWVVVGLVALFGLCRLLARRLRLSSIAVLGILLVPLAMNGPKWLSRHVSADVAAAAPAAGGGLAAGAAVDPAVGTDHARQSV